MDTPRDADVIVIGGGLAGLIAAAKAARAGCRVILLESASEFGGRARTRAIDGFHFNQGAHALYRAGPLERGLVELGIQISGIKPPLKSARVLHQGRLHAAPFDLLSLLGTGVFDAADKLDAMGAMAKLTGSGFGARAGETAQALFARMARRPKVRDLLAALMRLSTYGNAPDLADGAAVLAQMRLALDPGVLYLDHGWAQMVDALIKTAQDAGAHLHPNRAVAQITHGDVFSVAMADGTSLKAPSLILAVGPRVVRQIAGELPGLEAIGESATPVMAACFDIGLARPAEGGVNFVLGIDQPLYFSVHSVAAGLAPPGGSLVQILRYLAPGEMPSKAQLESEFEGLMDLAQPGWRPLEQARQSLFMMLVANDLPRAASGGLAGRARVGLTACPGLFVAGDWVGQEAWLSDAAAASAGAAAQNAMAYVRGLGP